MNEIDISSLDLNLLVTLDALLQASSVTGGAIRLGIGQPAASHALGRLRDAFDDPLLVRHGRRMVLTPRAERLREPLRRWLAEGARLVADVPFEPEESARRFVVAGPDLLAPLWPRLLSALRLEAPRITLAARPRGGQLVDDLASGEVDLALSPQPEQGPGLVARSLGRIAFAVVCRRAHPAAGRRRLSRKAWCATPHVMIRSGHEGGSIVAAALAEAGVEREVGLEVPSFLAALVAVTEADLFVTLPRPLVAPLAERFGLLLFRPPVELPAVRVAALWHERFQADATHQLFRRVVLEQAEALLA